MTPQPLEANSSSVTNSTTIFGVPWIVTLTCGAPPVCTYTKGFYRNHPAATSSVIAGLGGSIQVGSANLTATQAQSVLNGNVRYPSNALLNLAQQLITAELNVARGAGASSGVKSAIASANSAISVTLPGGRIQLSSALATGAASALGTTFESFNASSVCA